MKIIIGERGTRSLSKLCRNLKEDTHIHTYTCTQQRINRGERYFSKLREQRFDKDIRASIFIYERNQGISSYRSRMKFSISILLILVITIFNLVPPRVCQKDDNHTLSFDPSSLNLKQHNIVNLPLRITTNPCPEGEKPDSMGICRKPL